MTTVIVILSIILGVAFIAAGAAKVTKQKAMVQAADHLGVSQQNYQYIGGLEILGGVGVLLGIGLQTIGWLAALGLLITMVGGVVAHLRKGDGPNVFAPAAGLGVLSLVVMILDIAA